MAAVASSRITVLENGRTYIEIGSRKVHIVPSPSFLIFYLSGSRLCSHPLCVRTINRDEFETLLEKSSLSTNIYLYADPDDPGMWDRGLYRCVTFNPIRIISERIGI